jgi:hypothetical protein
LTDSETPRKLIAARPMMKMTATRLADTVNVSEKNSLMTDWR